MEHDAIYWENLFEELVVDPILDVVFFFMDGLGFNPKLEEKLEIDPKYERPPGFRIARVAIEKAIEFGATSLFFCGNRRRCTFFGIQNGEKKEIMSIPGYCKEVVMVEGFRVLTASEELQSQFDAKLEFLFEPRTCEVRINQL